jgi:acyl carrier protein
MSVQWGAWAAIGMAAGVVSVAAELSGAGALHPSQGAACLLTLLNAARLPGPSVVVSRFEWATFLRSHQTTRVKNSPGDDALFREMRLECIGDARAGAGDIVSENRTHSLHLPMQSSAVTIEYIGEAITGMVTSYVGGDVPSEQALMDAGLDSLSMTELSAEISARFSAKLPGTFTFDYPNISAMTQFVAHQLGAVTSSASRVILPVDSLGSSTLQEARSVTAGVVSHASMRPSVTTTGVASSSDEVRIAPADRTFSTVHDITNASTAHTQTIFGSFLDGSDLFDAALFSIGAEEATQMDPQHRLLLQVGGATQRSQMTC